MADRSEAQWSLPRGAIVLLATAGMVVSVAGIKEISSIVAPVFLAAILTIAVGPIPAWLRARGMPTWLAFIVTAGALYGIILGLFFSMVFAIARLATILPEYADRFDELVARFRELLADNGIDAGQLDNLLGQVDAHTVINGVGQLVSSTLSAASSLVFLLVLLLFMAADALSFPERIRTVTRLRPDIAFAFSRFASGTRSYLAVSTLFGLIVAVLDTAALWALSIPLPILWGLVSFITNYIPNIGFVIGLVPPALLGLLDGGWQRMLLVIVVYSVINVVIQSFIQPKFVSDAVGLSLTLTFLSLAFWTWVIGPLGAILAIPLTLLAKALLVDIDPATRWADALLSMTVPGDPDAENPDSDDPDPDDPGTGDRGAGDPEPPGRSESTGDADSSGDGGASAAAKSRNAPGRARRQAAPADPEGAADGDESPPPTGPASAVDH